MRTVLLSALLAVGFLAPSFAADQAGTAAMVKAENTTCICGKPVDAKRAPVTVTVEGKTHHIATCSDECAKDVKADPKKALNQIEAHNKKSEGVKVK